MNLGIPARSRAVAVFDGWTLYELPPAEEAPSYCPLWLHFKLMAPAGIKKRWGRIRAVWLSWNALELRLVKNAARFRLRAQEPLVEAQVVLFLELTYNRAWLLSVGGVTVEEIEAAEARLAVLRTAAPKGA
jgi:hypothetical protein